MNKMGSAAKVKLNSFDDLFGTEQPHATLTVDADADGEVVLK